MKRLSIVSLAFLLATTCAGAQTALFRVPMNGNGPDCRVGLRADRAGSVWERKLVKDSLPGDPQAAPGSLSAGSILQQRLHLTLTNLTPQDIVAAQLTVHGFSDQWRYVPLSGADPDLAQQVKVSVSLKGNGHATHDLSLARFSAITLIDITAVIFADGSTWRPDSAAHCSVTPSLLMLVSNTR